MNPPKCGFRSSRRRRLENRHKTKVPPPTKSEAGREIKGGRQKQIELSPLAVGSEAANKTNTRRQKKNQVLLNLVF
jgi:hypothetical protein